MADVEPGTMNGDVPRFQIGVDDNTDDGLDAATLQDEVLFEESVNV